MRAAEPCTIPLPDSSLSIVQPLYRVRSERCIACSLSLANTSLRRFHLQARCAAGSGGDIRRLYLPSCIACQRTACNRCLHVAPLRWYAVLSGALHVGAALCIGDWRARVIMISFFYRASIRYRAYDRGCNGRSRRHLPALPTPLPLFSRCEIYHALRL